MENALRGLIGKICHVYLDDIIIWSDSIEQHQTNLRLVLSALKKAGLLIALGGDAIQGLLFQV